MGLSAFAVRDFFCASSPNIYEKCRARRRGSEKFRIFADINIQNEKIMPEISKFYGIIIYMYIDDHNPPHFHVWYDDYEAEITIKDGIVTGSLPRRALRLVYEWLDLHRDELMENWERLSNSEAAKKIDPLK